MSEHERIIYLFITLAAVVLLSSCAPKASIKYETDALSKPGATVELGDVSIKNEDIFEVDAKRMLRDALKKELAKRDILWSGDQSAERFTLSTQVLNYEMGSAFKRWLLPGYGSTILEVEGELKDRKGTVVATINHKRGVYAGGAFTIGAWKTIFDSVASDIARELDTRIHGKGFVVNIAPWSEQEINIPPAERPLNIKILPLKDERADKGRIGERFAAFNVSMGNVYMSRVTSEFLTETLSDDLRAAGHSIVETGQDVTVGGEILKFWLGTETTMLYWDVVGEIEVKLTATSSQNPNVSHEKHYSAKQVKRTYAWPTEAIFNEVLTMCIKELMKEIRADGIWLRSASDKQ
jgi:hypothetical protein